MGWERIGKGGRFTLDALNEDLLLDEPTHTGIVGAISRAVNAVRKVPARLEKLECKVLPDLVSQRERTDAAVGEPFALADDLREIRQQVNGLRQTLETRYSDEGASATPAPSSQPRPSTDQEASAAAGNVIDDIIAQAQTSADQARSAIDNPDQNHDIPRSVPGLDPLPPVDPAGPGLDP